MPYVDSTLISWVDYDAASRTLSVRFNAVPVLHAHADVPEAVYRDFLEAPSKNAFYQSKIAPVYELRQDPFAVSSSEDTRTDESE